MLLSSCNQTRAEGPMYIVTEPNTGGFLCQEFVVLFQP
jgi:hypothetical protein